MSVIWGGGGGCRIQNRNYKIPIIAIATYKLLFNNSEFFIIVIIKFKIILIGFSTPESKNRFSGIDNRKLVFQNRRIHESKFTTFTPLRMRHNISPMLISKHCVCSHLWTLLFFIRLWYFVICFTTVSVLCFTPPSSFLVTFTVHAYYKSSFARV